MANAKPAAVRSFLSARFWFKIYSEGFIFKPPHKKFKFALTKVWFLAKITLLFSLTTSLKSKANSP